MGTKTLSNGLTITIPTAGSKNWAAGIEADCFAVISGHDHTGSGNGTVIGTNAIAAGAVTAAKLASDAVTTAKILDGQVTEAKLADDAATRSCRLIEKVRTSTVSGNFGPSALASAATSVTREVMPKAGKVTRLSVNATDDVAAGSVTITLYKNGSTTSKTLVLSSGRVAEGGITAESFAEGDYLELYLTTASLSPAVQLNASAWGHFIE